MIKRDHYFVPYRPILPPREGRCTGLVLDGRSLARSIEQELAWRVNAIRQKTNGKSPILATILVGDDFASATYVRMKGNACERVGSVIRTGGVGPMTITTLLAQTVEAAERGT